MIRTRKHTAERSLAKFSLIFLAIVALVGTIYSYSLTLPVSRTSDLSDFEIQKGESVKIIATHLKDDGLIRSPLFFRFVIRQQKLSLQAGLYQLSPSLSPKEIALTLTKGFAQDKRLTIPEGFRSEQIAEAAGFPVRDFILAAKSFEGQLFPDTYFLSKDITPEALVTILRNNFVKKAGSVDQETLVLASLVERETKGEAEKPVVAGILKKRLDADWALELDATIQYILGKPGNWWPNTTLLDRKIKSPYNTYLNRGLPPAPIGNPGLSSIRAVQNPVASPYWFYLHDKNGVIRFASSLEEHNGNIAKYIK